MGETYVRQLGLADLEGRGCQSKGQVVVGVVGAIDRSIDVGTCHGDGPMEAFVQDAVFQQNADLPAGHESVGEGTLLEGDETTAGQLLKAKGSP